MKIWIMQTGEPLHVDDDPNVRNMRAINLANAFSEEGHEVVVWSSCFYHQKKIHRFKKNKEIEISKNIKYRLIASPGYKRNIGLGRLFDHFILGIRLYIAMQKAKDKPDIAFIGFPPMEVAFFASRWLKRNQINYCLDIKDPWPTHLTDSFPEPLRALARILLHPYYIITKKAIYDASSISGITEYFIDWANGLGKRHSSSNDFVFYLSSELDETRLDNYHLSKFPVDGLDVSDDALNIFFVGTLSSSAFDFDPIISAIEFINEEHNDLEVNLIIGGEGELRPELEKRCSNIKNIYFTGWIETSQIIEISKISHIGLAPYKNNSTFKNTLSNKMIDYLALGLAVLTSIDGHSVEQLSKQSLYYIYNSNNNDLVDIILELKSKKTIDRNQIKKFYDEHFKQEKVYKDAVKKILFLSKK